MLGGARLAILREGVLKQFGFPIPETVCRALQGCRAGIPVGWTAQGGTRHVAVSEELGSCAPAVRAAPPVWPSQRHRGSGLRILLCRTFSVPDSPLERCALPQLLVIARVLKAE